MPALPFLYSDFDHRIGHFRRYRRRTLTARARAAGLELDEIRYVNIVGAAGWWLVAKTMGWDPTEPRRAAAFDRLVPLLRRVEERTAPPFGQSLFCAVRRPSDPV